MMKRVPILFLPLFIMLFSAMEIMGRSCTSPVQVICSPTACVGCNVNVVHISQADVGPAGYVISTPGRYCLIQDITWAPTASGTPTAPLAAITILSGNVELELNGYVLTGPTNFTNNVGIKIGTPLATISNVVITGGSSGSIQNFSLGIFVDPINNLLIQDLSTINNGFAGSITSNGQTFVGGIAVVGNPGTTTLSENVVLRRVNASFNGGVAGTISTVGTVLFYVQSAVVEDSQFNENTSLNNATQGLAIIQSNDVDVSDCQASDNVGAIAVAGFGLTAPAVSGVTRNQIWRSTAQHNLLGGTLPAMLPDGQNFIFADGFYLFNADECTLIDCVANQNTAANPSDAFPEAAAGFELDTSLNCRLERCIAVQNSSVGIGRGFHIGGNQITCYDCYSERNIGTADSYQYEIANFTNFGTPNMTLAIPSFDAVISSKAYGDPTSGNTVGIHLRNGNGCILDGNLLQSNTPLGILIDQTANCISTQNVIKHNQILNVPVGYFANGGTGANNGLWAIQDLTGFNPPEVPSNNVYYDNYAFNYPGMPLNTPPITNYNFNVYDAGGSFANPPIFNGFIASWTIPGPPPSSTGITKLTNLDITFVMCTGPS
jgi:parallel beta-helix repeat protein